MVAEQARHDPAVLAYRRLHLDGFIIQWTAFDAWLQTQRRRQGKPTTDLCVVLPTGTTLERQPNGFQINPPLEWVARPHLTTRTLDYALPSDEWVQRVTVGADNPLDQLRALSESLAGTYAWLPAQATIFVICDVTPLIASVRTSTSAMKVRNNIELPWARRIKLDIAPAARPQQVLDAFQRARRSQGLTRTRSMTTKHLRLAVFACAEHVDKPWTERLRLWNEAFPDWNYVHPSNFRRDAIKAQERIFYLRDDD